MKHLTITIALFLGASLLAVVLSEFITPNPTPFERCGPAPDVIVVEPATSATPNPPGLEGDFSNGVEFELPRLDGRSAAWERCVEGANDAD